MPELTYYRTIGQDPELIYFAYTDLASTKEVEIKAGLNQLSDEDKDFLLANPIFNQYVEKGKIAIKEETPEPPPEPEAKKVKPPAKNADNG